MPHEDRKRVLVQQWIQKPLDDYATAERSLSPPPLLSPAMFHVQQAVEKVFKAYLTWNDQDFPWTHNLVRLLNYCEALDTDFSRLRFTAVFLTPYATISRYPPMPFDVDEARASQSFDEAIQVYEFVLSRLPPDVHPDQNRR